MTDRFAEGAASGPMNAGSNVHFLDVGGDRLASDDEPATIVPAPQGKPMAAQNVVRHSATKTGDES